MRTKGAFTSIRPPKIKFYLRFMEQLGYSADQLFAGSGLSEKLLDVPHATIPIPTYMRVVANMLKLADMPDIAFQMGKEFTVGDLGILGMAFATSQNAPQANKVWQKYNRHFFGSLIAVRKNEARAINSFEFLPRVQLQPHLLRFFLEEYLNISIPLFRETGGCLTRDQFFSFTYPAPDYRHLYEELLETEAVFKAEKNLFSIYIARDYYTKPFPLASDESFSLCINYLDNFSAINAKKNNLGDRIRLAIIDRLPEVPTVSELAAEFNLSTRTFYRELNNEKVNYQQILDSTREEEAINYLTTSSLSPGEIAALLGYSDTSSFRRAFKTWHGKTITEFKASF